MNKIKEYKDKINKLESEKFRLQNENKDLYYEKEKLEKGIDIATIIVLPCLLGLFSIAVGGTSLVNSYPTLIPTLSTIMGFSTIGLTCYTLGAGHRIKNIDKKTEKNLNDLEENESELEFTEQLLEKYDRYNCINNENTVENKDNLVLNNHIVNNVVNTRGKVRSLANKRVN